MVREESQIKVTGIFDPVSLNFFLSQGIFHYGFDLRPKSYNFIQEYVLVSLVEQLQMGSVTLVFENEKDFMIQRVISEVKKVFAGEIFLEFHGLENFDLFDSFNLPYFFVTKNSLPQSFKRNQVGVVLHQDYFKDILEGNLSLEAHFLEKIERQRCNLRFESALTFPESYTDFISWEMLDLEISQSLCSNYRILDDEKVKKLLVDMKSFIRKKVKI